MPNIFQMKKLISIIIFVVTLYILPVFYNVSAVVPIGNYLILNGGYVKTTSSSNLSPSAITIEAWINPSATSGQRPIVSIGEPNNAKLHYEMGINGGSLMLDYLYGVGSRRVITSGFIPVNTWSHVAVTISSAFTRLYINGNQVFQTSGTGEANLLAIGPSIVLGADYTAGSGNIFIFPGRFAQQTGSDSNFLGKLDELRISTGIRDIAGLWQSGAYQNALTTDNNTFLLYHLDSNRGETTAIDSSGNSLNGNLAGVDNLIHYFGVLPTPTPFQSPIFRWVLPTLPHLRDIKLPPSNPNPTTSSFPGEPTPTGAGDSIFSIRENRPVMPR